MYIYICGKFCGSEENVPIDKATDICAPIDSMLSDEFDEHGDGEQWGISIRFDFITQ